MGTIGKVTAGGDTHLIASTAFATCPTAAATVAKVATVQDSQAFTLMTGITIHIKFTNSNTAANPTLNVNGTGAKNIYRYGTTAPGTTAATSWQAGAIVQLVYDGSAWMMCDWLNDNTVVSISHLIIPAGTTLSNVGWHGASYLTSSNQDINVVIPFNKVITASSVAVSSVTLITRQGNKYTHGSSSSTAVAWTVRSATIQPTGVQVNLTRTTTTNSQNNCEIGIRFIGTFKFT